MCGHLRLLNIACAAKAKPRLVTLTKPSRDSPLAFSLLGGQEKGFRIFIDAVESGSKAAEAGLKRGDQVGTAIPGLPSPLCCVKFIVHRTSHLSCCLPWLYGGQESRNDKCSFTCVLNLPKAMVAVLGFFLLKSTCRPFSHSAVCRPLWKNSLNP